MSSAPLPDSFIQLSAKGGGRGGHGNQRPLNLTANHLDGQRKHTKEKKEEPLIKILYTVYFAAHAVNINYSEFPFLCLMFSQAKNPHGMLHSGSSSNDTSNNKAKVACNGRGVKKHSRKTEQHINVLLLSHTVYQRSVLAVLMSIEI